MNNDIKMLLEHGSETQWNITALLRSFEVIFSAVKAGVTSRAGSPVNPRVFGWRHTPVEGNF